MYFSGRKVQDLFRSPGDVEGVVGSMMNPPSCRSAAQQYAIAVTTLQRSRRSEGGPRGQTKRTYEPSQ